MRCVVSFEVVDGRVHLPTPPAARFGLEGFDDLVDAVRIATQHVTQPFVLLPALRGVAIPTQLDGVVQVLAGVVEVDPLDPAPGGDLGFLTDLVAALPDPLRAVGDEHPPLGVGGAQQAQIADDQRPGRLGILQQGVVQRPP